MRFLRLHATVVLTCLVLSMLSLGVGAMAADGDRERPRDDSGSGDRRVTGERSNPRDRNGNRLDRDRDRDRQGDEDRERSRRRPRVRKPEAVVVTPSSGLFLAPTVDQFVTVRWSGAPPSDPNDPGAGLVSVLQCGEDPRSMSGCFPAITDTVIGYTRANGTGSMIYQVKGRAGDLTCDVNNPCTIGVFTEDGNVDSATFAAITFDPTPENCPAAEGLPVSGSGTPAAFRAMLQWEAAVCDDPDNLAVQYSQSNSPDGKTAFLNEAASYTITTIPFDAAEEAKLVKQGKTYRYAPLTASGLVFAYNISTHRGDAVDEQVADLKLSPEVLAKIFVTEEITNWNDPEILALNPRYEDPQRRVLPGIIGLGGPAYRDGSTLAMTSYLDENAGPAYRDGGSDFQDGPIETFPSRPWTTSSNDKVALSVAKPVSFDPVGAGFIGWMDSSTAAQYGLPTAEIQNSSGSFRAATAPSLEAAIAAGELKEGGFFEPDYSPSDANAYPIPTITVLAAGTNPDTISHADGAVLADFLRYVVGETKGQDNLPAGYVPLPTAMASLTDEVADAMPQDAGASPSPSPSPSVSVSPTVPPSLAPFSTPPLVDVSPPPVTPLDSLPPTGLSPDGALSGAGCASPTPAPVVVDGGSPPVSPSTSPTPAGDAAPSPDGVVSTTASAATSASGVAAMRRGGGDEGTRDEDASSPTPSESPGGSSPSPTPSPSPSKSSPGPSPEPSVAPSVSAPVPATGLEEPSSDCIPAASGASLIPAGAAKLLLPGVLALGAVGLLWAPMSRRRPGSRAGLHMSELGERLSDLRERW